MEQSRNHCKNRFPVLQKRAQRANSNNEFRSHLFVKYNQLKMDDLCKLNVATFMYKYDYKMLISLFDYMFNTNTDNNKYYTRFATNFEFCGKWNICYVTLRYVTLRHVMSCHVMSYHVMLCYVMLCYVMLCYVMLCYVMLCYVMLCYVMLCYVMLCWYLFCLIWIEGIILVGTKIQHQATFTIKKSMF